jgi:hypothetical protein
MALLNIFHGYFGNMRGKTVITPVGAEVGTLCWSVSVKW